MKSGGKEREGFYNLIQLFTFLYSTTLLFPLCYYSLSRCSLFFAFITVLSSRKTVGPSWHYHRTARTRTERKWYSFLPFYFIFVKNSYYFFNVLFYFAYLFGYLLLKRVYLLCLLNTNGQSAFFFHPLFLIFLLSFFPLNPFKEEAPAPAAESTGDASADKDKEKENKETEEKGREKEKKNLTPGVSHREGEGCPAEQIPQFTQPLSLFSLLSLIPPYPSLTYFTYSRIASYYSNFSLLSPMAFHS